MALPFQLVLANIFQLCGHGDAIVSFLETEVYVFEKFMFNPVHIKNFSPLALTVKLQKL